MPGFKRQKWGRQEEQKKPFSSKQEIVKPITIQEQKLLFKYMPSGTWHNLWAAASLEASIASHRIPFIYWGSLRVFKMPFLNLKTEAKLKFLLQVFTHLR